MPESMVDIKQLEELYGKESVKELLEMSLQEAKKLVEQLSCSLPQQDKISIGNDAHQLKGMAATMTFNEIAQLSKQLEDKAKKEDWNEASLVLFDITKKLQELEQFLSSVFNIKI